LPHRYARDQIKETREESEVEIKEARQQAQTQQLLTLANEFDQEPMATYRRGCAQERLSHKDDATIESYRILDFFETVGIACESGIPQRRGCVERVLSLDSQYECRF
jgi:23S rRNA maturation mini-RNase III